MPADDRPLRIAYLAYRGKPHVGGQGVYTRHLTKALVDLGHHVEVLRRQPLPDPRRAGAAARAAEPRHLQRLLPDADAGHLGAEALDRLRRGHRASRPGSSPSRWPSRCGPGTHLRHRKGDFDLVHDNQCLGYGLLGIQRDFPVLATIHHPITVDRRLELEHAETALQAPHAAALVLVHEHADPGGQADRSGSSPCRRTASHDIHHDHGVPRERMAIVPVGVDPELFRPIPGVARIPGRLITTASADVTMKGLAYLLEARGQAAHRARRQPRRHRASARRAASPTRPSAASASTTCVEFVSGVSDERIFELYAEAELAVVPSLYEGFSLPAIEAMCVRDRRSWPPPAGPCPRSSATTTRPRCVVPPGDSEALAARIARRPRRPRAAGPHRRRRPPAGHRQLVVAPHRRRAPSSSTASCSTQDRRR